jgi:hypothetical protein
MTSKRRLPYGRPVPQRKYTALEPIDPADTAVQIKPECVNEPDPAIRGWFWDNSAS